VRANFFAELFKPQQTPADSYEPDRTVAPACLPASYDELHATAVAGVEAALGSGEVAVEVDFPPVSSANARGDGSAKSEQIVHRANAAFVERLCESLGAARRVVVVGCTGGALSALGDSAVSLRAAAGQAAGCDVVVCVAPFAEEQWDAVVALGTGRPTAVVVVNGLLSNGRLPHAYYYKPLTAFSVQTGGVVRRYPGPYECYDVRSPRAPIDLEVSLATQGNRALPDTKDAQMRLQSTFGKDGAS